MSYTQDNRLMQVTTPLGKDTLLIVGLTGTEAISQLSSFRLDLIAENQTKIPLDDLLGKLISVKFLNPERFINGIAIRASQGEQDETFTNYRLEIVPQLWLLTRKAQSRIFQHMTVPAILKKVLKGLDVSYSLQGSYPERDYCVQYRETDFNFACRMMEEEGIFYFFKDGNGSHTMTVADTPQIHPSLPGTSTVIYESLFGGHRKEDRIHDWSKMQELRSGKYLLWDHSFELPHKHLEAEKEIETTVEAGEVTHKLKTGGNDQLEIYDFPGEYAQRFDGVDKSGGDRPADLEKVTEENRRTVEIRMQQEAFPSLLNQGASDCHYLVSGHKFTLTRHFNADGSYLLTGVQHTARMDAYRAKQESYSYANSFSCAPSGLAFRPPRVTPRPVVQGSQTAVVVGQQGEEIFTDKFGRVKVQFHWDRDGQHNADSSCWIRVATFWAGKNWGGFHIPRIGQEVVVDFLEGDPDQPIIVGSVYNAEQMHPYLGQGPDGKHKHDPKLSGIKSNSTKGGQGFNEIRLDDNKGKEQVFIHAEHDSDTRVRHDLREWVGHHRHLIVGPGDKQGQKGDQREMVHQDKHLKIRRNQIEQIGGDMQLRVGGIDGKGNQDIAIDLDKKETVGGESHLHIKKARHEKIDANQSLTVGGDQQEKVAKKHALEAGQEIHLKAGMKVILEAGTQISLKVGGNFIDISPAGVAISGTMVLINSGGAAGAGSGSMPTAPTDAKQAAPIEPEVADNAVTGYPSGPAHH